MKEKDIIKLFAILCFILLGLIPLFAIFFNDGSMDFEQAALSATEQSGIEWTSNILDVINLIIIEPILLLLVIGSAIPLLAAIICLLFIDRKDKWLQFVSRLNPLKNISFTKAVPVYIQLILLLMGGLIVSFLLRQYTGGNYEQFEFSSLRNILSAILIISFLDQGAILEEMGWRGFATPELQEKGVNPLKVAILIGLLWGFWHLPRDITTGVIDRLGMINYIFLYLPSFLINTIAASIIASYYMNKLNGSIIPAIMVHGIINDALGFSGSASIIEALTPYHQITKGIPMLIIALILVKVSGITLNFKSDNLY